MLPDCGSVIVHLMEQPVNAINRSFGVVLGIQDDKQINGSENERQWFSIAITRRKLVASKVELRSCRHRQRFNHPAQYALLNVSNPTWMIGLDAPVRHAPLSIVKARLRSRAEGNAWPMGLVCCGRMIVCLGPKANQR